MSVAKLIGPDIEELIRESPKELAAAVADLHPADLAELLEDLPREDRVAPVRSAAAGPGRGRALGAQGRDAPPDPPRGDAGEARTGARPPPRRRSHLPSRAPDAAPARGAPREDVAARRRRGGAPPPLRAPHRRPSHVGEVPEDPERVDRRRDPRAPAEDRSRGRDRAEPLRRRRPRPPRRLRLLAQGFFPRSPASASRS